MAKKPIEWSVAYWWREAYSEAHARVAELEAEVARQTEHAENWRAETWRLRGALGDIRDAAHDSRLTAGGALWNIRELADSAMQRTFGIDDSETPISEPVLGANATTARDGPRMWDGERWQPIGGALRNLAAAPDRNPPGAFDPPALPPMPDETPDAELEGEDGEAPIGWQASLDRIWDALNASEADLRERADKLTIEMGEGFARLEARIEALERGGTDWGRIIMARIAVLDGQAFHDLPARLVALEMALEKAQARRFTNAEDAIQWLRCNCHTCAILHVQQFAGQPRCNCADCVAHDAAEATR